MQWCCRWNGNDHANGGAAQGPITSRLTLVALRNRVLHLQQHLPGLHRPIHGNLPECCWCSGTTAGTINVAVGPALTGTAVTTPTSCQQDSTEPLPVTPGCVGPYTVTLTGGLSSPVTQTGVAATATFTGLLRELIHVTFSTASVVMGVVTVNPVVAPRLAYHFRQYDTKSCLCQRKRWYNNNKPAAFWPLTLFVFTGGTLPLTQSSPVFYRACSRSIQLQLANNVGCTGSGPIVLTNSPLDVSIVLTEPLCHGDANGKIVLTASGGIGPYQYALSPFTTYRVELSTGLVTGTYTFRIKDNVGCTKRYNCNIRWTYRINGIGHQPNPASCFWQRRNNCCNQFWWYTRFILIRSMVQTSRHRTFCCAAVGPYPNIKVKMRMAVWPMPQQLCNTGWCNVPVIRPRHHHLRW